MFCDVGQKERLTNSLKEIRKEKRYEIHVELRRPSDLLQPPSLKGFILLSCETIVGMTRE
jgi:hypothetical protein